MTDVELGQWVAAFLVGKILGSSLIVSRSKVGKALAYGVAVPAFAMLAHLNLTVAALVAIVAYLVFFSRVHLLSVINHIFVEFLLLILIVALAAEPDRLLSVCQVLVVSVWLFSVWQKVFHRQFFDGTVLYWLFSHQTANSRLIKTLFPGLRPLQPGYDRLIPAALLRCKLFAWGAMFGEAVMPVVALALSGSPLAVVCLFALAIPVGILSTEDDFMVTNMILSFAFLAPLNTGHIVEAFTNHLAVAIVLTWAAIWPCIHPFVVRRLGISTWRLFGYGMYASVQWDAFEITREGEFRPYTSDRVNVLTGFGACKSAVLRRLALTACFGRSVTLPPGVVGLSIRKRYTVADVMATEHTLLIPGCEPIVFDIRDRAGLSAFMEHLVSISRHPDHARTLDAAKTASAVAAPQRA